MEDKTYMTPLYSKCILRNTSEEVEIIDAEIKERGARNDEDWVTYIDSNGNEHIREHINLQLDFKPVVNDTWNSMFDWAKNNKMPTTRNCRIFEVAKELLTNPQFNNTVNTAVDIATKLVDKIGIETE